MSDVSHLLDQLGPRRRPGPELHHVLEAHPRLLHTAPSLHLVDQALGERLVRLLNRHGSVAEPRSDYDLADTQPPACNPEFALSQCDTDIEDIARSQKHCPQNFIVNYKDFRPQVGNL